MKSKVSIYQNASDVTSINWVDIDDVLGVIKRAPEMIARQTRELNQLFYTDKEAYKIAKRNLPLFVAAGCLNYRNGDLANLHEYSNLIVLDFDWEEPDPVVIDTVKTALVKQANALHLYAIWKSPAKGVKALLLHDNNTPAFHTELFHAVKNQLFPNLPLDKSGADISRCCYICSDPEIFINTNPALTPYCFNHDASFVTPKSMTSQSVLPPINHQFIHTERELESNIWFQMVCSDKKLLNKLNRMFNTQNPDYYKDGNRHTEVIRRAILYCKDGILYENALSSLVGQFGECSRSALNNADIKSMVNSCYNKARHEFGMERAEFLKRTKKQ